DILPKFTACYLRTAGDECAFIEAHTAHALPRLLHELEKQGKTPEQVKYIVVTHAHLDHASGVGALAEACPKAIVVAHPRTAKHMIDPRKLVEGATAVYGKERFTELYGEMKPIAKERVKSLEDGESIELGGAKLTAWHTYGHAFHHFVVDDPATDTVYTGDTFGLVYPALQHFGRFAIPSTSPTGFHAEEARKSIAKVLSLGRRFVAPTHFDAYEDKDVIARELSHWIDRCDAWVQEHTKSGEPADVVQKKLEAQWTAALHETAPHFGPDEMKILALDIELNSQGLAHAAIAARKEGAPAS
ncbi:MAG TPA: MBL fold metallo-hydrolase, partial [Polyangiaceae bacterium]